MPLHVSSICAHHQDVKIALHSLWYHHTYRCDDTRGCVMQFWPNDDEHMCSKHVEAWNKLIVKQKFCASSWLITEINILRCTVSKTSKCILLLYVIICKALRSENKYICVKILLSYGQPDNDHIWSKLAADLWIKFVVFRQDTFYESL